MKTKQLNIFDQINQNIASENALTFIDSKKKNNKRKMNLFTDKICHVCNKNLFPKEGSCCVLDGFHDQDTNEYAHFSCRVGHYKLKKQKGMYGLWSEVPLTINTIN